MLRALHQLRGQGFVEFRGHHSNDSARGQQCLYLTQGHFTATDHGNVAPLQIEE
jgi:hypothetical protein